MTDQGRDDEVVAQAAKVNSADDVAPDDRHKVEKIVKLGQENLDPNAGTE